MVSLLCCIYVSVCVLTSYIELNTMLSLSLFMCVYVCVYVLSSYIDLHTVWSFSLFMCVYICVCVCVCVCVETTRSSWSIKSLNLTKIKALKRKNSFLDQKFGIFDQFVHSLFSNRERKISAKSISLFSLLVAPHTLSPVAIISLACFQTKKRFLLTCQITVKYYFFDFSTMSKIVIILCRGSQPLNL